MYVFLDRQVNPFKAFATLCFIISMNLVGYHTVN